MKSCAIFLVGHFGWGVGGALPELKIKLEAGVEGPSGGRVNVIRQRVQIVRLVGQIENAGLDFHVAFGETVPAKRLTCQKVSPGSLGESPRPTARTS